MIIAIDFDGTCVTHDFPKIGKDIGAVPVLRKLVEQGHKLILFTMRANSSKDGEIDNHFLTDAVNWFKANKIALYGIQSNPTQSQWTTSPKAYAELYIDDSALGCPLKIDLAPSSRPYVNWKEIEELLYSMNILKGD